MTELFDVYDKNRNKTGRTVRRGIDQLAEGEFHLVANVVVINDRNEILIQKRSKNKKQYPGCYGLTGGAVCSGENSCNGCKREAEEEIGYVPDLSGAVCVSHVIGHTIIDTFMLRDNLKIADLVLQESEVAEVMWMSAAQIKEIIADQKMMPKIIPCVLACLNLIEAGGI